MNRLQNSSIESAKLKCKLYIQHHRTNMNSPYDHTTHMAQTRLLLSVSDTLPRGEGGQRVGGWVKGLFQWFLGGMDPLPGGGGGIFSGAGCASLGPLFFVAPIFRLFPSKGI